MALPNGVYIIQGEISLVVTAMRRTTRYGSHARHVSFLCVPKIKFHNFYFSLYIGELSFFYNMMYYSYIIEKYIFKM